MLPGTGFLFHSSEADADNDIGQSSSSPLSPEELKQQLSKIGGWWGVVAQRWVDACDTPGHALSDLKRALLEDTISYGVVSAVMLTIAQAEMCLEDNEEAPVLLRAVKQVHENCWYLCFAANMLCLYLSTTEYLHTAATHPKDILLLLSKRYPTDFGRAPECNFQSWMRYLKVGKLDAFKRGFQMMVPGLLSGVYLRCDWPLTVGPLIISLLTCLLGYAMWRSEMKTAPTRPSVKAERAEAEAFLHPSVNSRELRFSVSASGGHPEVRTSLPPRFQDSPNDGVGASARNGHRPDSAWGDAFSPRRSSDRSSRSGSRSPRGTSPRCNDRSSSRRSRGSRQEVRSSAPSCWNSSSAGHSRKRSSHRRPRRGSSSSHSSGGSQRSSQDEREYRGGGGGRRDERNGARCTPPALAPPPEPRFPQRAQPQTRRFSEESPRVTFTFTG